MISGRLNNRTSQTCRHHRFPQSSRKAEYPSSPRHIGARIVYLTTVFHIKSPCSCLDRDLRQDTDRFCRVRAELPTVESLQFDTAVVAGQVDRRASCVGLVFRSSGQPQQLGPVAGEQCFEVDKRGADDANVHFDRRPECGIKIVPCYPWCQLSYCTK